MTIKHFSFVALCGLVAAMTTGCQPQKPAYDKAHILEVAEAQVDYQIKLVEQDQTQVLNPRSVLNGVIQYIPIDDWCSGFFPGIVWEMYRLTGDAKYLPYAERYTLALDSIKHLKWHHDVGFMMDCSYGQAYAATGDEAYAEVLVETARSLATRFRPAAGVIQSWDEDRGWQGERGWMCPTIIDNMMNLELMFKATQISGDSTFWHIAVSHADTTMKYHFRPDYSCYHVVDYDKVNGGVRRRCTAQGYADESTWARGETWALYGYGICYYYTRDPRYLEQCRHVYDFIFNHPRLPEDLVPYWDYDDPAIPNAPRDASSAAITASALYLLSEWIPEYRATADKIMASLASPAYLALVGTNGNFLLMHSVGAQPFGGEIDVPINYADYYFLEALLRADGQDLP